ncbi:hypothetical protein L1987_58128 [Smallanthus sonchifolius]|uniref:Uncharacterized protein n=1 Tax=Smallanthus sonchifolius TaxID=185202 RepID=A0ACB9DEE2_9ASTR|nr:hypothetical protein L1987_58128 [Smallanthus sonchifolius]
MWYTQVKSSVLSSSLRFLELEVGLDLLAMFCFYLKSWIELNYLALLHQEGCLLTLAMPTAKLKYKISGSC